jgi:hypothetical protein
MKNYIFKFRGIGLLIFFVFFLSGCQNSFLNKFLNKTPVEDDWENDVLLAQDCGMDGLKCCPDREPSCFYGQQCCTDPNNPERNVCLDDCTCGQKDRFCCLQEPKCKEGLGCSPDGYCVEGGNEDQPCRSRGQKCNDGLICFQEKCVKCGLPGNPCCESEPVCLDEQVKDSSRTECYDNGREKICAYCGSDGKIPCQEPPACLPGHILNSGQCWRCGGFNQPCCNQSAGVKYECDPKLDLKCELGFCTKK